jgi:hypothetical protein
MIPFGWSICLVMHFISTWCLNLSCVYYLIVPVLFLSLYSPGIFGFLHQLANPNREVAPLTRHACTRHEVTWDLYVFTLCFGHTRYMLYMQQDFILIIFINVSRQCNVCSLINIMQRYMSCTVICCNDYGCYCISHVHVLMCFWIVAHFSFL